MRGLSEERKRALGRFLVIAIPFLWLGALFLAPFLIVAKISLSSAAVAIPPYEPLISWADDGALVLTLHVGNYKLIFSDPIYLIAYASSLRNAAVTVIFTLLLGFPLAYFIATRDQKWRAPLLLLVMLPFWTSFLIRVYAWIGILKPNGVINGALLWLGVIEKPLVILNNNFAVIVGMVYGYLPFMVLPLYAHLEKMDWSLLEAASDLGAKPFRVFRKVTLPLAAPGIVAGSLLVFIPAVGEYIVPALLGGPDTLTIGATLWNEFFSNRDWPVASTVAVALVALLVGPLLALQHHRTKGARP
ncbi:ABC transporter permease subunit [Rhodoblastus acidophilus]|jgi:putrescine transport system permease protein|uniref:ABC transporter permease subunit n=1 Tax=Rhodoblastus acidophilus TaxID=1074 RepID=A0A6N8DSJ4_RHOAC|nr:ABC transporter permease subunit [Rhodoblastus acidophilus]MCW2275185.1 putrescine transport system permease protein [Rhodoblastus acidophilus]MTV32151.1 ABC transporter permease subunit [Rhodoblastus acidophilus]